MKVKKFHKEKEFEYNIQYVILSRHKIIHMALSSGTTMHYVSYLCHVDYFSIFMLQQR